MYIFTDFQSSDEVGSAMMTEYLAMAAQRKCPLVPVILSCSKEENLKRLGTTERSMHGKLTDDEVVSCIRTRDVPRRGSLKLKREMS